MEFVHLLWLGWIPLFWYSFSPRFTTHGCNHSLYQAKFSKRTFIEHFLFSRKIYIGYSASLILTAKKKKKKLKIRDLGIFIYSSLAIITYRELIYWNAFIQDFYPNILHRCGSFSKSDRDDLRLFPTISNTHSICVVRKMSDWSCKRSYKATIEHGKLEGKVGSISRV